MLYFYTCTNSVLITQKPKLLKNYGDHDACLLFFTPCLALRSLILHSLHLLSGWLPASSGVGARVIELEAPTAFLERSMRLSQSVQSLPHPKRQPRALLPQHCCDCLGTRSLTTSLCPYLSQQLCRPYSSILGLSYSKNSLVIVITLVA